MTTAFEQMPFEDMIRTRTKSWMDEYDDANLPRVAQAIEMTMRNRGDYFGYFFSRPSSQTQWRAFTGKGMVTYPIIGRSVRAKTATATSTKVQTEVEAVRPGLPEKAAAADMARNIVKYCREKNWTKKTESTLAELCQLQRFCFTYNNYHTDGGMIVEIPESSREQLKSGETLYDCSDCGFQYSPEQLGVPDIADEFKDVDLAEDAQLEAPRKIVNGSEEVDSETVEAGADATFDPEADPLQDKLAQRVQEHTAELTCPDCGTNTLVMSDRARYEDQDVLTGNYLKKDVGFMDTQIVPSLLTRIDSYQCLGFDYKRAGWFNYHPLVPAYELLAMAPQLAEMIQTGANRWSEAARWHYELNNNTSSAGGFSYRSKNYRLDELVEPNVWWISPNACHGWRSPSKYELFSWSMDENGTLTQGEAIFTIEADESIEEAWTRQFGSFKGARIVMWDEEIVAVGNEFFTDKWNGIPWKIDAQSFFPQGEENQLKLQDAATNVLGMTYSHTRRRANSTLVADTLGGFSEDAIKNAGSTPGGIIYRGPTTHEVNDQDWRKFIGYLEPGELSAAVYQFIQLIIEIAKEESGIFNETVGNVESTDETLGGRRMALNQSLSMMTPTQQAKALALIENSYIWLELWQKTAPDEAYTLIKGTFEEEWKQTDIEAFRALDIRRELFVTVVEGTDIPRTVREQEEKFLMAVSMQLFVEPNPIPIAIRNYIIKSVFGLDFDISNYSAYKRLAARRYEVMKAELEPLAVNEAFTIIPDPMGFPVRQLRPEITASFLQDVRTMPRDSDEHLVFIEYYTDQINGLAGAKEPDEKLIAACETQISAHRAYLAAKAVQATAVANIAASTGQPAPAPASGGEGEPQPNPGDKKPQPAAQAAA